MYLLHCSEYENKPVVHIEGRLDSVEDIEELLTKLLPKNIIDSAQRTILHPDKTQLILDLSKTDFISEKCLQMFQRIISNFKIEFKNYPLYIGMQLVEYNLLMQETERTNTYQADKEF